MSFAGNTLWDFAMDFESSSSSELLIISVSIWYSIQYMKPSHTLHQHKTERNNFIASNTPVSAYLVLIFCSQYSKQQQTTQTTSSPSFLLSSCVREGSNNNWLEGNGKCCFLGSLPQKQIQKQKSG